MKTRRIIKLALATIASILSFVSCSDKEVEPKWEPAGGDYMLVFDISQYEFPPAGGEATIKLSILAHHDEQQYEYIPEHDYSIVAPQWVEVVPVSGTVSEFIIKVAENESFKGRSGRIIFTNYSSDGIFKYEQEVFITQGKTDSRLQYESLSLSSSSNPETWLNNNGWHLSYRGDWAFINVITHDDKKPIGIMNADWISRVDVSERTWVSTSDGSKAWRVGFLCSGNDQPETRTTEVWVGHGNEKLGPYVIEQERFHTLGYPSFTWLNDVTSLSSNGGEWRFSLDSYNDEQPWMSFDGSWVRVKSCENTYTYFDEYINKTCKRWIFSIIVDKNYGSSRSCNLTCGNASGEYYGPFTFGQQGSSGDGDSYDASKSFPAYAWLETSGGYDHTIALESTVNHLNQYGILIYKSGSSYYFTNFDGKKVYVTPSGTSSTYTYYSDYEAGDKYNNYQTKKAIIYVRFGFSAF